MLLAVKGVVDLGDTGIKGGGSRRGEDKTGIVEPVADGGRRAIVALGRKGLVVGLYVRVHAASDIGGAVGVERRKLRGAQPMSRVAAVQIAEFPVIELLRG